MCGRFSDIQPARRLPPERFSPEVVRSPIEISRGERTTSQVLPRNGRGGRAWLAGDPEARQVLGARRGPGGWPGGPCATGAPSPSTTPTGEVNGPGSGRNPPRSTCLAFATTGGCGQMVTDPPNTSARGGGPHAHRSAGHQVPGP